MANLFPESKETDVPLEADPIAIFEQTIEQFTSGAPANISFIKPARGTMSAEMVEQVATCATRNSLGTLRPSEIYFGLDSTKQYLLGIPVRPNTPGATEVTYRDGRATVNLYKLFKSLDRVVQKGTREIYDSQISRSPLKIGDLQGAGIIIKLSAGRTKPIQELSEEEKAARNEKRRQTLADKKARKESAAAEITSEE